MRISDWSSDVCSSDLRPIMGRLADAASSAAQRHEWAWRERARHWELFAPSQGPARVALDLITRDDDQIFQLIRETGLGTNMAASGFGQATFARFCGPNDELPPSKGVHATRSSLRLFQQEALACQLHPDVQ